MVVGISIELSGHCKTDSTIITFISRKPHLRGDAIELRAANHHDDESAHLSGIGGEHVNHPSRGAHDDLRPALQLSDLLRDTSTTCMTR